MPITSPGNDDDTGENHQPTLRKNTAEPVEQTLKQNNVDHWPIRMMWSGSAQGMLMAHTHRRGPFGLLVLGPRSWMPAMAHTAWA